MSRIWRFAKNVVNGWLEADAFSLAATLAYYAIFSIAPLLLLSILIASLVVDRTAAVERLTGELISLIGPTGSDAIKQMLDAAGTAQTESWSGIRGYWCCSSPLPALWDRFKMRWIAFGKRLLHWAGFGPLSARNYFRSV